MSLCPKHLTQHYRYGHFLDETIYDKNKIVRLGDYAEIELKNKSLHVVGHAIIDLCDIERCSTLKWYMRKSRNTNYAMTTINGKKIFLHRFILNYSGLDDIDHIDRNGLNNKRTNLAICSHSDNLRNQHVSRKGIFQVKSGRYRATITKNYESIYIGTYDTFEEALAARFKHESML